MAGVGSGGGGHIIRGEYTLKYMNMYAEHYEIFYILHLYDFSSSNVYVFLCVKIDFSK